MKRFVIAVMCSMVVVMAFGDESGRRMEFIFGPRVGATGIFTEPAEFNAAVQEMFPDGDRTYFPEWFEGPVQGHQTFRRRSHAPSFLPVLPKNGLPSIFIPHIDHAP